MKIVSLKKMLNSPDYSDHLIPTIPSYSFHAKPLSEITKLYFVACALLNQI